MPRYEGSPQTSSRHDRLSPLPLPPSVRDPYRESSSALGAPGRMGGGGGGGRVRSPASDHRRAQMMPPPPRDRSPGLVSGSMQPGMHRMSSRGGGGDPYSDPYARPSRPRESSSSTSHQYKILCVSNLNHKVNDGGIRDALMREFGRFGELSVKVVQDGSERLAYLYFRSYEDAREARHTKHRMILYDKELDIVPIYDRPPPPPRRALSPQGPPAGSLPHHEVLDYGGGGGGGRHGMRPSPTLHHHHHQQHHSSSSSSSSAYRSSRSSLPLPTPSRYDTARGGYSSSSSANHHHHSSSGSAPVASQHGLNHNSSYSSPHSHNSSSSSMGGGGHSRYHSDPHHSHSSPSSRYHNHHQHNQNSSSSSSHHSLRLPPHLAAQQHPSDGGGGRDEHGVVGGHPTGAGHPRSLRDSKKDRFPNYLHHIPPEEDEKATRTLFVGNLEVGISDEQLRRIFEKFGTVEDIDVKRPPPGQGNAYAFIKFLNLDMANRAKVEMSGQYIGKFQCKIGYGKATPTTRIWIGGLGTWTSLAVLESEFDRFGAISKIDFVKGDNHAYVQYDSAEAATAAIQEMRGYPLGGEEHRLRVDYADPGPYSAQLGSGSPPPTEAAEAATADGGDTENGNAQLKMDNGNGEEGQDQAAPETAPNANWNWWNENPATGSPNMDLKTGKKRPRSPSIDGINGSAKVRKAPTAGGDPPLTPNESQDSFTATGGRESSEGVTSETDSIRSIGALVAHLRSSSSPSVANRPHPAAMIVSFILKTSLFPAQLHFCSGTTSLIESLVLNNAAVHMNNSEVVNSESSSAATTNGNGTTSKSAGDLHEENPPRQSMATFRITQRLRLDANKIEDVTRRLQVSQYCMFVASPGPLLPQSVVDSVKGDNSSGESSSSSSTAPNSESSAPAAPAAPNTVQRKLPQLVAYLKGKEAAGVIPLTDERGTNQGFLYAFPACSYSLDLLRNGVAPNLTPDESGSDQGHLVVLVIKNNN